MSRSSHGQTQSEITPSNLAIQRFSEQIFEVVAGFGFNTQVMADAQKLFYIIVLDENSQGEWTGEESPSLFFQKSNHSFRYTRPVLQSILQLMGCKQRHSFKITKKVFGMIKNEIPVDLEGIGSSLIDVHPKFSEVRKDNLEGCYIEQEQMKKTAANEKGVFSDNDKKPAFCKKRITVVVKREKFLDIVCAALSEYRYVSPNQRMDLIIACRIREHKESMTILLCGTSGCGKSTLSSLLASRLGITTVVSTDSIRHMMRSFVDEKENPLLWASTYHAGECLDPVAVAEAKAKKKAKKFAGRPPNGKSIRREPEISSKTDDQTEYHFPDETLGENQFKSDNLEKEGFDANIGAEIVGHKAMAVEGYKAQSEMVIESLDRLISAWEERKESVVVEGVHLSLNFVMGLMKRHPSIIPFMIYISNEEKHLERFAIRAKYMTLDPAKNKYVKYIRNIRAIQDYLCKRADKHIVPKVNNTNVDKSVASIHATIFSCLRRREAGEHLYDQATNTVKVVDEEYHNVCDANSLSSKGMFKLIQRQGSSRRLMALVNTDGSVAKAWPFDRVDSNGKPISNCGSDNCVGSPMYGPLQIGKEEPVNLQFGNFGISSWPNDTSGASHASSIDGNEVNSRYSSLSNSPRHSDGPAKELTEELPVPSSDEEPDEVPPLDSEDELSNSSVKQEDLEGSVDEESARSDEGYENLAPFDEEDGDYSSEDSGGQQTVGSLDENGIEDKNSIVWPLDKGISHDACSFNLKSHTLGKSILNETSLQSECYSRSLSLTSTRKSRSRTSRHRRVNSRSQSAPAFEKYTQSVINQTIL